MWKKVMRKRECDSEKVQVIALWLVCFLLHLIVINHFIGWLCTDTAGYWLHAATFTGHDWSEVANSTSKYYSWGYSLLLTIPFILSPNDMVVMSRIAIVINALLCAFTFPLLYGIGKGLFSGKRNSKIMICAFITSLYSTYFLETSVALSETLLFFLYIFLVWLIVQYFYKRQLKYAILSSACCSYMYITHHRTLGIMIAFIVMLLVMYSENRNWKELLAFGVPFLLCLAASGLVEHWLSVRENMSGIYTGNTYNAMFRKVPKVLGLNGMLLSVQNMVGAIWYILTGTFATAGLGIISVFRWTRNMLSEYKGRKKAEKEGFLYCFLVLSLLFSIGISIITTVRTGYSGGRIDMIFYGRYFENVLSVFIFIGLVELSHIGQAMEQIKEMLLLVLIMLFTSVGVHYFTMMVNGNTINYFSVTAVLALYSFPTLEFSVVPVSIYAILVVILTIYLFWMGKGYRIIAYCLIAGNFLYVGYNAVVNVDEYYMQYAYVGNYPTHSDDAILINDYINNEDIEAFGVYLEGGYEAFSYQLMNPQRKVFPLNSLDEIESLPKNVTYIIVPKSLMENMDNAQLEIESANYAVFRLTSANELTSIRK